MQNGLFVNIFITGSNILKYNIILKLEKKSMIRPMWVA